MSLFEGTGTIGTGKRYFGMDKPVTKSAEAFAMLDERLQRWVWRQGWTELKPIQANAIPEVLPADRDVLISASTAGGKTEAAWLPAFTRVASGPPSSGFSILAIAPLKSLINDQARRLEDMASEAGIAVHTWHGDVSQQRKTEAADHPSGVLLTTPESLEAMMVNRPHKLNEMFRELRYVVIDEFHSFVGTERGKQLQSLLLRLELAAGRRIPRVALSATFADAADASAFLRPDGSMPCSAPSAGNETHPAKLLVKEYVADTVSPDPREAIAKDLFDRLRGSNNLIFTNSRKDAEAYTLELQHLSAVAGVPDEWRIHHGSLSRTDRHAVEKDLQSGLHPATAICTASMELGIDIGRVQSVAQIGTAGSPSTLRQRLGRSGRRGEPSVMRIYSVDEQRDDPKWHLRTNLVQNIAVVELLRQHRYDTPPPEGAGMSVIVQQLLSLLAQYGSYYPDDAFRMLCSPGAPFAMLSREDFERLVEHLVEKRLIGTLGNGQIVVASEGERLMRSPDFYSAFTTPRDYTIIDSSTQLTIGSVQYKPYYGEVFILSGRRWIVDAVKERSSTVFASATTATGKMMFEGSGQDTSPQVGRMMRQILESDADYPYLDPYTATPTHLQEARNWYRRHHLGTTPWLPLADTVSLYTWGGMRVNRTIATLAAQVLDINPSYDHISVSRLDPDAIRVLSRELLDADLAACAAQLASSVPRVKKERGKWDPFLPDHLLDSQYAAARLDLPAAARVIQTIASVNDAYRQVIS